MCVLWLALVARLLAPAPVESRWSVFNLTRERMATSAADEGPWKTKVSVEDDAGVPGGHATIPTATMGDARKVVGAGDVLYIVWLAGIAAGVCALALRWRQTRRLAAKTQPATDRRLVELFMSVPAQWRRNVELRMSDAVQTPTLAGVMRPQIWLPPEWPAQFSDTELRNVLLHELGHARRGDLAVQWLFAFAQCLHWFNPLVWLAARAARLDREMACDAWALARCGADHAGYGATLMKTVQLLRAPLRVSSASVAMASGRQSLRARISGIGAFRPLPAWRGVAGILAMCAALAAVTTSRTTAEDAPVPADSPSAPPDMQAAATTPAPVASGSASNDRGNLMTVKSILIEVDEKRWEKLCAENPAFKDLAGKWDAEADGNKYLEELDKETGGTDDGGTGITLPMNVLGAISSDLFAKIMKALKAEKSANLLSDPSVTMKNGERGTIEVIREFRYPSAYQPDAKNPAGAVPTQFTTKNIGLTLEVQPKMEKNGSISLDFSPQITALVGFIQVNGGKKTLHPGVPTSGRLDQPVFSTQKLTTTLTMNEGQSAVIGGLREDTEVISENGVARKEITVHRLVLLFISAKPADPNEPVGRIASDVPHEEAQVEQVITGIPCDVSISSDGGIKFNGKDVTLEQLGTLLADLRKMKPDAGVAVIHSDGNVSVERFAQVIAAIKHAGITKVSEAGKGKPD